MLFFVNLIYIYQLILFFVETFLELLEPMSSHQIVFPLLSKKKIQIVSSNTSKTTFMFYFYVI